MLTLLALAGLVVIQGVAVAHLVARGERPTARHRLIAALFAIAVFVLLAA